MRAELLDYLVCPGCGRALDLHPFLDDAADAREIDQGLLVCRGCAAPYPLAEGIPRVLPNAFRRLRKYRRDFSSQLSQIDFRELPLEDTRNFEALHRLTSRAFGYEWNAYRVTPREEDLMTFFWLTGADPELHNQLSVDDVFSFYPTEADLEKIDGSHLAGKTVVDVGCGMGKYLAIVSDYAETVIGLDLSDALVRARAVVKDRRNVHLVQGNILAPPLKLGFADLAYSLGVLHHTPDTHSAFRSSASLVKPGGQLAVWLYPKEKDPGAYADRIHWIQDDVIRPITCRLPPRMLRIVSGMLGRLTFVRDRAAARHQATGSRIARRVAAYAGLVAVGRHRDPEIAAFLNFDWYSPQYRSYHTEAELERWYNEAGFDSIRIHPQRVSGIGNRIS